MSLVKVTSKLRNGSPYVKDMLIDLSRITEPAFENVSNEVIILLNETQRLNDGVNQGNNNVQYVLSLDLDEFVALSRSEMILVNILSRDGRNPVVSRAIFFNDKMVGGMFQVTGGTQFLYEEQGGSTPVTYVVSETISAISSATSPTPTPIFRYKAVVEQSGIDNAPIVVPNFDTSHGEAIEETIQGDISFSYVSPGEYEMISASGVFGNEPNMVSIISKTKKEEPIPRGHIEVVCRYFSPTVITIKTYKGGALAYENDLLDQAIIKVEVYKK